MTLLKEKKIKGTNLVLTPVRSLTPDCGSTPIPHCPHFVQRLTRGCHCLNFQTDKSSKTLGAWAFDRHYLIHAKSM